MEKSFRLVNDFGEAQVIFDRAQRAEEIGAQLVIEKGEVVALALCLDGTSIYAIPAVGFLTGQYLAEELERLMEVVPSVTVLDLKIQLPFLKNHSRRIVDGIPECRRKPCGYGRRRGGVSVKSGQGYLWI